jgi:serine/threonine protein kinase/DNA-binding beta-propeller fold protein YncE
MAWERMSFDPRIGTELAGYRIETLLGRGGMSVVYCAEDRALKRRVALKVLAPELADDERFRERFLRESRVAASIDHANVIPIYEAGGAEGLLYIAMRYVVGTDLGTLLAREGRLEPGRALSILGQVASALDTARFARGLVHRDVKPGNILIAGEGGVDSPDHVYLCDFGLSTHTAEEGTLSDPGHFMGTIDYVAPEQIEGEPVDGRADVYSLGCVLYESLTGQAPFRKDSKMAIFWAHLQEPPPSVTALRPDLPVEIDAVAARALAKSPDDRYATCRELVGAARDALKPGSEEQAIVPERLPDRLRRRRFRLLLGLAVLLAVTAAASIPSVLLTGGPSANVASANGYLLRIDPATNTVVSRIVVGSSPGPVAVGKHVLWVANMGDGTVSMIDPSSSRVVQTYGVAGYPDAIAAVDDPDTAWVANEKHIVAVRPSDSTFAPEYSNVGGGFCCVAAGAGSIWASNDGTMLRIDPRSGAVVHAFRAPPKNVVFGAGSLWSADDADVAVRRLDPATHRVIATIETGALSYLSLAFADGSLWLASHSPGRVLRIDPVTNRIASTIQLGKVAEQGSGPLAAGWLAVGLGSLWITDHYVGVVSRIDPVTGRVVATIRVPGFPYGIDIGHGAVWVAVARYP